jgi:hypothetical protein
VLTQIRISVFGLGTSTLPETARPNLVENTAAAVDALFARRALGGRWLQVELAEHPIMTSPLTGKAVHSPPAGVLRQGTRPLAVLIGGVLAINATGPRCIREPLIAEARARGLAFQQVAKAQLQRLIPEPEPQSVPEPAAKPGPCAVPDPGSPPGPGAQLAA